MGSDQGVGNFAGRRGIRIHIIIGSDNSECLNRGHDAGMAGVQHVAVTHDAFTDIDAGMAVVHYLVAVTHDDVFTDIEAHLV